LEIAVCPFPDEALHFNDVSALAFQRGRHFVQRVGSLAQHGLAGFEADFGLRRGRILIDVANHLLHRGQARGGLGRDLLGGVSAVARVDGVLVSFVGLVPRPAGCRCCARESTVP
jgi:hypothetical protein